MRNTPHAKLLCMLTYGSLVRSSKHIFSGMTLEQVEECLETLTEEIMMFFSDADSFNRDWTLSNSPDARPLERSIFQITFDEEETEASDKAERGDFRSLEKIIRERGYLRTSKARRLVADRILDKKKRGSPASKINIETFEAIFKIQFLQKCSEFHAKKVWLDENPNVAEETLSSRIKRAKKTETGKALMMVLNHMKQSAVQNSDNPEP